ncbi:helix-turn-helix domain-containing protein [Desulfoscipio gibsoniae]
MTNWFEVVSNPDVRFYDINGKKLTLDEVKEFAFKPAEMQFPAGHGMFVSHYFLNFWSALLGDAALFYIKIIDCYIYGGEKDFCFPSVGTIAEDLNVSPNTARSRLKKLEEFGFVARFNVRDMNTGQFYSNLIKIRMDIPLIPDALLSQLPARIQEAHQKYMQRVKKPATLLEKDICSTQGNNIKNEEENVTGEGVLQTLNKGGSLDVAQGEGSFLKYEGYSSFEAPSLSFGDEGTSKLEGGVPQKLNTNLLPNLNYLNNRSPNGDDENVEPKKSKNHHNSKEEPGDPRVKKAIANHCRLFKEKFNTAYLPVWGKEGKQIKTILACLDREYPEDTYAALQEIFNLQKLFFISNDDWIINSGYTIGAFIVNVNKLRKDKANNPKSLKSIDKLKKQKLIMSLYCS